MAKSNRGNARRRVLRRLARGQRGEWVSVGVTDLANTMIPLSQGERWVAMWRNNHHAVMVSEMSTEWGMVTHLWVRRHDNKPRVSWRALQRIKNDLVGRDRCGIEIYPAEEDKVDEANMYHLWVMPVGWRPPFTLGQRQPWRVGGR